MFPVLAARHPDLSDLFVYWWRPKGDPGSCGEQRDLPLRLQPITALLPGQLQRAPGIYLALGDVDINTHTSGMIKLMFVSYVYDLQLKSNQVVSLFAHQVVVFFCFYAGDSRDRNLNQTSTFSQELCQLVKVTHKSQEFI